MLIFMTLTTLFENSMSAENVTSIISKNFDQNCAKVKNDDSVKSKRYGMKYLNFPTKA